MNTFSEMARRAAKLAIDKSPTILTTVAVIGVATTAYLAGKASFEAAGMIHLKEADDEMRGVIIRDRNELIKQRLELVWKLYIPAATTLVATTACIIGSNRIGSRRAAGLAAAYLVNERILEQYKNKVVETIGERKEQGIRDAIAQDNVTATYDPDMEIYGASEGYLVQEKYNLHYFRSTAEKIEAAVNEFNRCYLNHEGYGSVADFYELLNIPTPANSEQVGWYATGGLLEVTIDGATAHGKIPILTMDFKKEPVPNRDRFR